MAGDVNRRALSAALAAALELDAPVNTRLKLYADALEQHLPPFAHAVERLVARLKSVGAGQLAPNVGDLMPPFLLPDGDGHLVSLEDCLARAPVAIAFHRGHWCPYCQINTKALAEVQDRVSAAGGQFVAITPETQRFVRQQKSDASAKFRILSDIGNGYALSINIAIWVGDEVKKEMSAFGRDLSVSQGNDSWFLPIPATFVVARNGRIAARFIDPDYRRRMEIEDLCAALETAAQPV